MLFIKFPYSHQRPSFLYPTSALSCHFHLLRFTAMPSFLDLPPETRVIFYDSLLSSSRSSKERILAGVNNFHLERASGLVRKKSVYRVQHDHIRFDGSRSTFLWGMIGARCNIHLADVSDLIFLAATCRLPRSELLALAWSNADMAVRSPTLYMDLHCILYDRLP